MTQRTMARQVGPIMATGGVAAASESESELEEEPATDAARKRCGCDSRNS